MKILVQQNATSVLADVFIQDSSSTVGAGLGSLVFNTSGLIAYYHRQGDNSSTAISLATMTLGTWATGGFIVVDGTNMKGTYQVGFPNAMFTALGDVVCYLSGAANMAPLVMEFQVVAFNPNDGVHLGLSCLPNTAVTTNASLITSGTGTDQLSVSSGIGQANVEQWDSVAIAEPSTDGIPDVNVLNWRNQAVPATSQTGVPLTDPHYWNGTAFVSTATAGIPDVNVKNYNNQTAATDANNLPKVDVEDWKANAVPVTNVNGVPLIDAKYLLGTIFATPATAGIMDVNAKNINNVSTSSVTTINANQGTTQPINFDGTGATAYVKSDVEHWETVAPNALVQGKVDATDNVRTGTAQAGAGGTITLDAGASATDQFYRGLKVSIVSGTGANQGSRLIGGYVGATKVASVVPNWTTNPDSTSVFILSTWCGTDVELWELVTPNGLISGRLDVSAGAMAANVITASAINAGALNGKGDWLVSSSYPANFGSLGITAAGKITEVALTDTMTTYTGNTPQTGDVFGALPTHFSSLSIDTSGRVTLVPSQIVVKKNVALNNFEFLMVQSSDHVTGKTGLTFSSSTAQISIDGAAFAGLTNSGAVTEIAFGIYKITLAAADLNGNVITLRFSGSGADDRFYLILTQP